MAEVKLVTRRHYVEHEFEFNSLADAVKDALAQLESGEAFPDYIEVDGIRIWEQSGPFETKESLEQIVTK